MLQAFFFTAFTEESDGRECVIKCVLIVHHSFTRFKLHSNNLTKMGMIYIYTNLKSFRLRLTEVHDHLEIVHFEYCAY